MSAVFPKGHVEYREANGQKCLFVWCPACGRAMSLRMPPFTWDAARRTIGPASVLLPCCGYHGYYRQGEWHC